MNYNVTSPYVWHPLCLGAVIAYFLYRSSIKRPIQKPKPFYYLTIIIGVFALYDLIQGEVWELLPTIVIQQTACIGFILVFTYKKE